MGVLFKTYNKKHQLHLYNEIWVLENKRQLEEVLGMFQPQEAAKVKVTPVGNKMEVALNAMIINCRDLTDLKLKFSQVVDLKDKYQKIVPPAKLQKPVKKH